MKHTDGVVCLFCEEKLETAHPSLRAWFSQCIKPRFHDVHVAWAWRGKEDQQRFFNDGHSGVCWPRSAHNRVLANSEPCSEALDLFRQIKGEYYCGTDDMKQIADYTVGTAWGDKIRWGLTKVVKGHFVKYDLDHFQLLTNQGEQSNGG